MNLRKTILAFGSITASVALIALLIKVSRIDLHAMLALLRSVDRFAFLRLTLLMGFNTYLSSQKWWLVDRAVRRRNDLPLPQRTCLTLTSIGVALGQILPVQIAVSIARTLGSWACGGAFLRGTLGTLFEQAFDFLIVCFLALASLSAWFLHGGGWTWLLFAISTSILAICTVGPGMRLLGRVAPATLKRWPGVIAVLHSSVLLDAKLGRRLVAISILRFVVLVFMGGQTTQAIHFSLPLWHLAAAMPFVVLAAAVGITPGGLGITEFIYAAGLAGFGAPLAVTAQWALANRLLTCAASFVVAIAVSPFLWIANPHRAAGAPTKDPLTASTPSGGIRARV